MYQKQISIKYDDKVNPYTIRVGKQFIFKNKYGEFNFIKFQDVKKMEFKEILDYLLDVCDYENFLRYIEKNKKAIIVEKIKSKIIVIAKERIYGTNKTSPNSK